MVPFIVVGGLLIAIALTLGGETLEQRENGKMKVWIEGQIKAGLAGISAAVKSATL